jgi:hypothetical protein
MLGQLGTVLKRAIRRNSAAYIDATLVEKEKIDQYICKALRDDKAVPVQSRSQGSRK